MLHIYVDADACPVKREIYKVAGRYRLSVTLVANSWIQTPMDPRITLEVVKSDLDAADDWIVDQVDIGDVVVTTDIPLADRSLKKGAKVLSPTGRRFTDDNIGDALAGRELMSDLREAGIVGGGPSALSKEDRSRFLQRLDEDIQAIMRRNPIPEG